ncbi:MAG TPA: glycoside hydrolase family 18 protein [Pseudacidobacterium sp.]|jgi:chitinase|nr:glycoside hydrolase family 18 protein [Pseudacidobacterium sp.]
MSQPALKTVQYRPLFYAVLLLAVIEFLCSNALAANEKQSSMPVIIAYVFPQDHALQPGEIAAQKLTRINYAFANIKNGKIIEGFPSDAQNFATLAALKQQNPSLTVLVSVGGWLWSGNFSDVALTKESRAAFIQSVIEFIDRYHLDGLDIDWEYPGQVGAGNRFRPEDKENYTLLLKEMRERFNQEEKKLHRRLYLSIATGAQPDFLDHTEMEKVQKYVDTVNLMAYDYYEPDSDKITGHHAPLFMNPHDPKKISADESVREYEQGGVPAAKIVLGVPFYGHIWGDVPDTDHGLYQPGKQVPNAFAGYGNISTTMLNHGFTRYWDASASVPYLYNPETRVFVSYEDSESLTAKSKYVKEHKLGGMMFWDYSADPSGTLLDTINSQLKGASR